MNGGPAKGDRAKRSPVLRLACVCFAGYLITVGMVPAVCRHTGDSGRLQWLPSVPGAITRLEIYEWPARQLSRIPVFRWIFELSAEFWWVLLDPPDTTP